MKRQIRNGVFETNSSSQHSLVIKKNNEYFTTEEIMDGIYLYNDYTTGEEHCVFEPSYHSMIFGRSPFRALVSFKDKWLYACASLCSYNDDTYKELIAIAMRYIPGLKKVIMPTTSDSIAIKYNDERDDEYRQKYGKTEKEMDEYLSQKEKEFGLEEGNLEYWETSSGYWDYNHPYTGCVDENILSGFLKKEGISLEEYLTNKKYIVIQDGDEYDYWTDMKESGLINIAAIDHEYPEDYKERINLYKEDNNYEETD